MKKVISLLLAVISGYAVKGIAQPSYDMPTMQMESLGRGVAAVRTDESGTAVTWRYLPDDSPDIRFNIYKNGKAICTRPTDLTYFVDSSPCNGAATYEVRPVIKGKESKKGAGRFTLADDSPTGYISIPVTPPENGRTPAGEEYHYYPGNSSVADVDGDGEYELIVRMEPSNRHDNSHDGYTGNVFLDCYRITGERLWRIDMGRNVRAGSHYVNILAYDFDGDSKAEIVTRTCDGTKDAEGHTIGDPKADWREEGQWIRNGSSQKFRYQGRIFKGKDYITVFSGKTGKALYTTDYIPQRGSPKDWGDNYANRSDRFLACAAYLDGVHPSIVMCRGYYTRTVIAAFDWDGKRLVSRWVFDSDTPGNEVYAGQGFHNLRVGDVDGDGKDEIVYGSCTIDDDGKGLYSSGTGHGDAMHMTCFNPSDRSLQIWSCHENCKDGSVFRSAADGRVLFQVKSSEDVGRCMAADIDPTNPGVEMWSIFMDGFYNFKGEKYVEFAKRPPMTMALWWDGDLLRELLDKNRVLKYRPSKRRCHTITTFEGAASINGTKGTPMLQADILGDWREEVVMMSEDAKEIRIYITPYPTLYRFHTFMADPIYRLSVVYQNVGYNQPTQPGFYFGPDLEKGWFRGYEIR